MKNVVSALLGVMILLGVGSCSNELPEGAVWGPNGEIIEANLEFTMAELLADVDGVEWSGSQIYERYDDGSISESNIYSNTDGGYTEYFKFADGKLISVPSMFTYATIGVPADGEQTNGSSSHYNNVIYYCDNTSYEVDNTDNKLFFTDGRSSWSIVAYNSECIVVDCDNILKPATTTYINVRMFLRVTSFPSDIKEYSIYNPDYMVDVMEYLEKYDSKYAALMVTAYESKDYMNVYNVWADYATEYNVSLMMNFNAEIFN